MLFRMLSDLLPDAIDHYLRQAILLNWLLHEQPKHFSFLLVLINRLLHLELSLAFLFALAYDDLL